MICLRFVLLLTLLATLTACYSREEWGRAMIGAADRMDRTRTLTCTTTTRKSGTYTSCY